MFRLTQSGKGKSGLRLQLSALLCLLLLLGASTAEVAHHHPGDFPAQKQSKQSQPTPQKSAETICPLCIAMHAVLPVATPAAAAPMALVQETPQVAVSSRYLSLWSFELFGRPPPVRAFAHV